MEPRSANLWEVAFVAFPVGSYVVAVSVHPDGDQRGETALPKAVGIAQAVREMSE